MTTEQWNQVRVVFDAVLERPASEQTAFLENACDDPEVRAKARELLTVDPVTTDWFGGEIRQDALGSRAGETQIADLMGTRIGPYRIIEPLGRGGMGSVYLAEREDVQKKVALKLVGVSLGARESAHRFFLLEQRVLARLEHPNIARFLDAGITEEGVPFFAMEYVEGESITDHCKHNGCSRKERLAAFTDVCEAVSHAHRSLIVHSDLKPSNIFVTKVGTVKLLDFGIAKLLEEEGNGLASDERHRPMTAAYAAPEQLRGKAPTTATDVYQLGVVLRELLTGKRTADEAPTLDGELEAIITKATAENTGDRYASAETLLEDLRRFQAEQPVSAHPDTLPYRARKFVQRNRWGVAAVSVIAISLIGGLGAALWQARVAGLERDQARLESEKSEEVTNFLMGLFEANDPFETSGDSVTVREVLEQGMERLEFLKEQPELYTSLLKTTARIYSNLGDLPRAEALYREALKILDARSDAQSERNEVFVGLGGVLVKLGRNEEAEPFLRRVIEKEPIENVENALQQEALLELYGILHATGRNKAADSLFIRWQETINQSAGNIDVSTAERMVDLSTALGYRGQIRGELEAIDQGKALLRKALPALQAAYGPRDPRVAYALTQKAMLLVEETKLRPGQLNRLAAADSATRTAVEAHREIYQEPHLDLSLSLLFRSSVLNEQGHFDEAETTVREARSIAEQVVGTKHPMWTACETQLARVELATNRYDQALTRFRAVRDWWANSYGETYLKTLQIDIEIGGALVKQGRFQQAEDHLLTTYETMSNDRGDADYTTQRALSHLVNLYAAWNKPEKAARYRALLEAAETDDE